MNVNLVKRLVKILEDSRLTDLEIEEDGFKIKLSKRRDISGISFTENIQSSPESKLFYPTGLHDKTQFPNQAQAVGADDNSRSKNEVSDKEQKTDSGLNAPVPLVGIEIKSPIVGTFYASPSPDAEPYVKTGDLIKEGQVVCIVEAMKLMNEIEADVSGKILKILVSNGQPVEYNQPLFLVEKL